MKKLTFPLFSFPLIPVAAGMIFIIAPLNSEASTIDAIIENVRSAMRQAEEQTQQREERIEELEKALAEAVQRAEKYKKEAAPVDSLLQENQNLRRELTSIREQNRRLSRELAEMDETKAAQEKDEWKRLLNSALAARLNMEFRLNQQREEIHRLRQSLQAATIERETIRRRKYTYRQQFHELHQQAESSSAAGQQGTETVQRQVARLRRLADSLDQERTELHRQLLSAQNEKNDLQGEIRQLQEELNEYRHRLTQTEKKKESLSRRNQIQLDLLRTLERKQPSSELTMEDDRTETREEIEMNARAENKKEQKDELNNVEINDMFDF